MTFRPIVLILFILLLLVAAACNSVLFRPASAILVVHAEAQTVAPTPTSPPSPAPTLIPTSTSPPTPALTPTAEPTSTPTPEPSPVPTTSLAAEYTISGISGHRQLLSLDCETSAALDWARTFGKNFNELAFQSQLPISDNPDYGFVGDVNSPWGQVPPYGYGVHAGPVADLLNAYGIPAKAYKGYTLEQIIAKLAADKPVIAWVIGNVVGGVPYEYTDKEGRKVTVAAYEHVVIVTGYNEKKLRYMTNGKFFETPKEVFLNSWGILGNMVVVDQ
jgi:uncharacterized protein YvpB